MTTERIQLVFPPEVSSVMSKAVEAFHRLDKRLPNGSQIAFEREELPSMNAAQRIARGDIKAVMWIAPFPAIIDYVNNNLINLGARQSNCREIFSTGLVAAMNKTVRKKLTGKFSTIARETILPTASSHLLNFTKPIYADSGLAAALYLDAPEDGKQTPALHDILSYRLFSRGNKLLAGLANNFFGVPRAALVSEQEVVRYNQQAPETARVEAVYLNDKAPEIEYTACISEADWISPPQKAAAEIFIAHLLSQDVQIVAQQEGFRSAQFQTERIDTLSPQWGVQITPLVPFESMVAPEIVASLKLSEQLNPSTATMYVIDSSSSMEGPAFISAKRLVRGLLEQESALNPSGLIAFDSHVELISPPTLQKRNIFPHLTGLATNAGSALYDAILLAAEQLGSDEFKSMQRRIILITDGNDQSSVNKLIGFSSALDEKMKRRDTNFVAFVAPRPEVDQADLRQIAGFFEGTVLEFNTNTSLDDFVLSLDQN